MSYFICGCPGCISCSELYQVKGLSWQASLLSDPNIWNISSKFQPLNFLTFSNKFWELGVLQSALSVLIITFSTQWRLTVVLYNTGQTYSITRVYYIDYLIWLINSNYVNYIYQNASVGGVAVGRKSSSRQNVGARNSVGGGNIPTSQFAHPDTEKEKTKCSKFEHLLRKESRMGNLNLKAFLFYFLIQTLCPDNFWISNFSLFMWTFGKVLRKLSAI